MSRCLVTAVLFALVCQLFAKTLLEVCTQIGTDPQYRTAYIECPPQCIVVRYPGNDDNTKINSTISFDDAFKECTQLGKDNDREGRMVRFSAENEFVPVVSEIIPNVTFFMGAKRKEEGFTWNYGDYVYTSDQGDQEIVVAKIPSSFVYMDTTSPGFATVDNSNLLCLQVMCKQFEPNAAPACVFSRTQCNASLALVCEILSSTADINNQNDARSCYNCINGDFKVVANKNPTEIISTGYPKRRIQQSMECVSVISTVDEWSPLVNLTAEVGCLEHVDDFLEIYHEKDRVSGAKLIARLRSGSKTQLIVPANVLLRYHASDVVKEYVSSNNSHEIYLEPSREERLAQLMRAIDTVASPLEHCSSMAEQGFRVQVSASNDNYCPDMFYEASWKWQNITIAGEHLTAEIECALVITAARNRSVRLEIVEAQLINENGQADFIKVYDGPELEDPVIVLPDPVQNIEPVMSYSNISNTTETNRFVIVLKMGAHSSETFGSVTIRYRMASSREWSKKRWEGRTRDGSNYWRYWRNEDEDGNNKASSSSSPLLLIFLITIAIGVLATGIFAYYRRWSICISLQGKLSRRSIFHNGQTPSARISDHARKSSNIGIINFNSQILT